MKRDLILKMAASSMVFATVLTGCGPFGGGSVASMSSKPATVKDGAKYAKKAEKAMAKGEIEKAIAYAERSSATPMPVRSAVVPSLSLVRASRIERIHS